MGYFIHLGVWNYMSTLLSCDAGWCSFDAAFGIGGPEDVVPRPPEHVRCKNFGCNKPRAQALGKSIQISSCIFPISVYFPHLSDIPTLFECCIGSPDEHQIPAPTFVSCFSTMHSQGTLIQDTQSKRSLRLRLRQVPGPPRRHGPVCCELQWLCCVPGVFTTDYHLYFTRRQSIGRVVLTKRPGIDPVSKSVLTHVVHVKFTFLLCIGLLWRDSELLCTWCW